MDVILSQTSYCLMTMYAVIKNNLPKFSGFFLTYTLKIGAISCTFSTCVFFVVFLARFYTVGLQQH